jgi:D-alanyl-lipoteichoic acid acyltransferase DltB (MBOAT superfamily)
MRFVAITCELSLRQATCVAAQLSTTPLREGTNTLPMDSTPTFAANKLGKSTAAASESHGRIRMLDFAVVAAQLILVLLLLRQFQIESPAFRILAMLAFAGFAVHSFLPLPARLPFFTALSLISIPLTLGLANGAWLIGIGFVLIAACHLPVSFRIRGFILLGLGVLLITQRATLLPTPWSEAIWPILGAMFMFRLIAYFYDLRHDKTPVTLAQSASYFFMLPNACFPLLPVIDFKTYRRSHYSGDAYLTYQKGVDWIVRGIVHLILYRYFYYHVTLAPSEVTGPAQFLQYVVANFMLYLRVSGLFHLIVGMVHLFGFNLPETHNRYLLAASFTDFWRRINIYWKDFMQKIFYFPAVFALKRFGTNNAIIIATLYVFLLTWLLHSYQWFWLRGTWLLAWHDMLFWAVLGVLVVANSLYEIKHGRSRSLSKKKKSWQSTALTIAKTYATFWFIAILWSFWTSESIIDWLALWPALTGSYTAEALLFPLLSLLVIVLGSLSLPETATATMAAKGHRPWALDRAITIALALGLVLISMEGVHTRVSNEFGNLVSSLRSAHLSRLDNAKLERGYYEGLLSVDRFNSQLWEVYSKKPANWLDVENAGLKRFVDNFAQNELIPSFVSTTKYGTVSTNRWGMRDQEYTQARPADTLRAAVLGPSTVMGWGVGDGATFEALLEERLGSEPVSSAFKHVELLNMGVPGYQPPQQLVAFDKVLDLQPNAILYVAAGREISRSADYLAAAVEKRLPIPYPALAAIVDQSGASAGMDKAEALKLLKPHGAAILQAVYGEIAGRSAELGIRPVWVFLPQVRGGSWQEETPETVRIASDAGFAVINLADVYQGPRHRYLAPGRVGRPSQ